MTTKHDRDQSVRQANQVRLRGRVSSVPTQRELPSGTVLVSFRLVVPREPSPMTTTSRQVSDWVECTAWGGRVRARALAWAEGDTVEVTGALRRRYYRPAGAAAAATRVEVEVLAGKVVERAPAVPEPG